MYEIVTGPDIHSQCFSLRVAVFHHEQHFPLDTEFDAMDHSESAIHFLLRLLPSHNPVGTVRVYRIPNTTPQYKLSRLCVLKHHRHLKLGSALVQAVHDWVQKDIATDSEIAASIIAHSQMPAIPFYQKFGYKAAGDPFDEDGAPHQKMVINLPLSPS